MASSTAGLRSAPSGGRARARLGLVLLALLPAGCDGTSPFQSTGSPPGWDVQVDTLASGTIRVRNLPPADRSRDPVWRLEEELRIGTLVGDATTQFHEIRSLHVTPDEDIVVFDAVSQSVRVFDAEGSHVRTFARQGNGPGQLLRGMGFAADPGGNLWIADLNAQQFRVFDLEGNPIERVDARFPQWSAHWWGAFDRDGTLRDAVIEAPQSPREWAFRSFDGAGALLQSRTLLRFDQDRWVVQAEEGFILVPYAPFKLFAVDDHGRVWSADSDRFVLVLQSTEGDTLRIVEHPGEPEPVTAEERDRAIRQIQEILDRTGGGTFDPSVLPLVKPILRSMALDRSGRLWVETTSGPRSSRWEVFDPEGRFVARAEADFSIDGSVTPILEDSRAHLVIREFFEPPFVVRARLQR